ncbi:sperm flagellar protein 1-like [Babylonia areolata]|uniref:sperm flagellar protein 1-like n=1 Tax=Babylonia areolata TaxID=304850 RepID=UPI003FD09B49
MSQYVSAQRSHNGLTRLDVNDYFDEMELEGLFQWIDRIPLTRPKKNLAKDFSDGVLVAEMVKHYFPRMVELHNYTPAHSTKQKMENWYLLNKRVLRRLDLDLSDDVIRALSNAQGRVVEKVLMMLRSQIDTALERRDALRLRAKQLQETLSKVSSPSITAMQDYGNSTSSYPRSPLHGIPHSHPARVAYSTIRPVGQQQQRMDEVSKSLLEEKEMESMAKDETIRILNSKLKRLEHLLHLKELRIGDLEARLAAARDLRLIQGCLLSPVLFNIFLEKIVTDALERHERTVSIGGRTITNLRFADDIDGLAGNEEELVNLVECLDKTSATYGMGISAMKTKLMTNNSDGISTDIRINGDELDTVQSFKYLRAIVSDERSKPDILSKKA